MSSRLLRLVAALALVAVAVAIAAAPGHTPSRVAVRAPERVEAKAVRYTKPRPRPSLGARAAKIALKAVGVPYRWGGASPASGFDCSGLILWAYGRVGVDVPHSSYALFERGRRIARSRMKPGDVLFFAGLGHVGLYVGRGRMVHAPRSGRNVEVVSLRASYYAQRLVGARRLG